MTEEKKQNWFVRFISRADVKSALGGLIITVALAVFAILTKDGDEGLNEDIKSSDLESK